MWFVVKKQFLSKKKEKELPINKNRFNFAKYIHI